MKRFVVETPRGTFTRTTERTYTHIAVLISPTGSRQVVWCGSEALAKKARANAYDAKMWKKEIYAVQDEASLP